MEEVKNCCCISHEFVRAASKNPNKIAVIHVAQGRARDFFLNPLPYSASAPNPNPPVYDGDQTFTFSYLLSAVDSLSCRLRRILDGGDDPHLITPTSTGNFSTSKSDYISEAIGNEEHFNEFGNLYKPKILGICMVPCMEYIITVLSILRCGEAFLPLDPSWPKERILSIISSSGVDLIIVNQTSSESGGFYQLKDSNWLLNCCSCSLLCISRYNGHEYSGSGSGLVWPCENVRQRLFCYLMYTSGSTGMPKGILGTEKGLLNRFIWMKEFYPLEREELLMFKTSISFIDHLQEFLGPVLSTCVLVIPPFDELRENIFSMVHILQAYHINRLIAVPSLMRALLPSLQCRHASSIWSSLKMLILSGEVFPLSLWESLSKLLPETSILNLYGSTEVSGDCTYFDCKNLPSILEIEKLNSVPIGVPMSNCDVKLVGDIDAADQGEIYVGGLCICWGYISDCKFAPCDHVKLLHSCDCDHPSSRCNGELYFRTGDFAKRLKSGHLVYLGRKDRTLNINGQRVALEEIEEILRGNPIVSDAAVVSRNDHGEHVLLEAFLVLKPENESSDSLNSSFRCWMVDKLPLSMIPNKFIFLKSLPVSSTGKIDYALLTASEFQGKVSSSEIRYRQNDDLSHAIREVFSFSFWLSSFIVLWMSSTSYVKGTFNLLTLRLCFIFRFSGCIGWRNFDSCPNFSHVATDDDAIVRSCRLESLVELFSMGLHEIILAKSVVGGWWLGQSFRDEQRDDTFYISMAVSLDDLELEKLLAFCEALLVENLSDDDDFFMMGGNSIMAAHVSHKLGFDMRLLYIFPSPSKLRKALLEKEALHEFNLLANADRKESAEKDNSMLLPLPESDNPDPCVFTTSERLLNIDEIDHDLAVSSKRLKVDANMDLSLDHCGSINKNCWSFNSFTKECAFMRCNKVLYREGYDLSESEAARATIMLEFPQTRKGYLKELWKVHMQSCVDASPLVVVQGCESYLLIGSHSHKLLCINATSGLVQWTVKLEGRIECSAAIVCDFSQVVVGCYKGKIYFLNIMNGDICWTFQTRGEWNMLVANTDTLSELLMLSPSVFGIMIGTAHVLPVKKSIVDASRSPLKVIWESAAAAEALLDQISMVFIIVICHALALIRQILSVEIKSQVKAQPVVDIRQQLVWCGTHDHNLYALDYKKYRCVHKLSCGGSIFGSPAIDEVHHMLYVASTGGQLTALSIEALPFDTLWQQKLEAPVFGSVCIGSNGNVICCLVNGYVVALDLSGSIIWKGKTGGPIFAAPCFSHVLPSQVLICSRDGHVYSFEMEKGDILWEYDIGDPITASAYIDENLQITSDLLHPCNRLICICTSSGSIHLLQINFDAKQEGNEQKKYLVHEFARLDLQGEIFSSPVMIGGRIFVGCRDDYVYCIGIHFEDSAKD
ncbi:AMP-binding enzyme, C-terminal domain [Dillenia turbinata]|uniref:AMP-binding enzyme, C-terminal domain n=1 Tax=Dillenia turbinata TaxID=194707 RepID=A0AAN8UQ48_9MAGN